MKKLISGIVAVAMALSLAACEKETKVISLSGKTMGTTYHVKYLDEGSMKATSEKTHEEIEAILKDVNAKMSTYKKDSELSRFNQNTQVNTPIEISADFAKVLAEAIRLNKVTEGALDVTVGPVVNLWGFGPEKRPEKQPTPEQLAERQAWVGIDKITLDMSGTKPTLSKALPQVYIDLSSIAKGFGVDLVAEKLEQLNAQNYMVEIGGEIRAKGKNIEGKPWQIAIEKPTTTGERAVEAVIGLDNMGMASSGDYRIYFEENGKRFAHEIDPKTGYPIQHHLASITVLAPTSMTADGLSTGLFVLGEDKALEVAEKNNLAVYLIIKTDNGFVTKSSSAFKKLTETKE